MNNSKSASKTSSFSDRDSHSYAQLADNLSEEQLVRHLKKIIKQQQARLVQFQTLFKAFLEKLRSTEQKYQAQRLYSTDLTHELQTIRQQNQTLKIQVSLMKSDNLLLKSQLIYRQSNQITQKLEQHQENTKDNKSNTYYKKLQIKLINIRKYVKSLLKALQKIMINNQQQQSQLMSLISQIMSSLK